MDLGLKGRSAIVCASSRGLGKACATSLAREGVSITLNGRNETTLAATVEAIGEVADVEIAMVVGDIGEPSTRASLLEACPAPDILINNNGGPPPGRFADWDREQWVAAFDANMITPILMTQSVLDGMVERGFGRIVNITSAMVKQPLSAMGLSTSSRTALTAMNKALSRDVARANVTMNNLLPERFDTDRQKGMAELRARMRGGTIEDAYEEMRRTMTARRLGRPEEFGDACAFLCSAQAGFITGQSLQLDGGNYPGIF